MKWLIFPSTSIWQAGHTLDLHFQNKNARQALTQEFTQPRIPTDKFLAPTNTRYWEWRNKEISESNKIILGGNQLEELPQEYNFTQQFL